MILDLNGEPAVASFCGETFGDGPGFENPIHFEPEIVMKAGGIVLLDDEHRCAARSTMRSFACGFGGAPEVTPGFVFLETQAAFLSCRFCLVARFFAAPPLVACARLS